MKHFFSFKKKEILGKEKLLESWKNVLKQGNLEGGPSKDKFLGTISSAFDKDEKEIMASFDWEAQLSFMKDKGIDRVSIHKIPMDRLKALSAELKSHRKAYADNKMEVLKKRITEFNNAATLEEAIKLHLGLIDYTQDYDDLLKYMDNIIDVFARIDTSISKDETKAQFDILKEFDSYKGEAFKREVISNVLKASSIFLSRFGEEKVATEGFFDSIKEMFSSKKDQPKEEPYEQTKVKGNLLDFMRAFNVNKFEVEEGTIDLNGLSTFSKQMLLKGDSVSTDLVKDIGDTVNWIDTVSKNNLPIFKSWAKELSNLNDNLDKLDGQADVNVLKGQIVNVFKSAKGSPDIVNNYKTNPNILGVNSLVTKNYRGDLSFIEPRNVFSGKVDTSKAKYNKLTKEQVIKLKSYYDHISSKINDFAFMEDVYTVDMTDAPIRAVYPELTDDDWKIIWAKKCYIVDVAGGTFTNIIGILGEVKYGLLELIGGLIRESVSSNVSNEGFVDSVKDMFKNKYQDKTLNTLVKDMKNFTNEPAPKKLDADIEIILMSYHEYYVTNVKLAARKKLSMNVKRFKELSTNDPKALDAMSNEVLDEAKKADKGYWPVVDKVQKEVEKAHGWDKVNVLIKFLKETNGDKALYKAHGSIMLQAGVDDVADIYDESNKDDITITKVVDIVWNDNNDDYKVAAMDNPKLSKSLTKMCYKLNDIDN